MTDLTGDDRAWMERHITSTEFGQMVVAERELMFARRAQRRLRRELEANRAETFVHLAPQRALNSCQHKRRALPVHYEREVLQHALCINLLFRWRNFPIAININQREDAIRHLRARGQTQFDAHAAGRERNLRDL